MKFWVRRARDHEKERVESILKLQAGILNRKLDFGGWEKETSTQASSKHYEISGVSINKEEVAKVKQGVFEYFSNHFKVKRGPKQTLRADLCDKQVSVEDNQFLVMEFTEEEVKFALDPCRSSKSPGPERFNFGFLKENWDIFKEDFLQMFNEFHTHGKLVKGLNP